tara:strand:- start:79 stop:270 length:192 start_codon:yes stop_codon:yes gene_type:complete
MENQDNLVVACCVCKRVRTEENTWERYDLPREAVVSHTYCPPCFEEAKKGLQEQQARDRNYKP